MEVLVIITPEEFKEWQQSNVTKALMEGLVVSREIIKEGLVRSNFENEEFAKGKAQMLLDIREITYEDLQEMINAKY